MRTKSSLTPSISQPALSSLSFRHRARSGSLLVPDRDARDSRELAHSLTGAKSLARSPERTHESSRAFYRKSPPPLIPPSRADENSLTDEGSLTHSLTHSLTYLDDCSLAHSTTQSPALSRRLRHGCDCSFFRGSVSERVRGRWGSLVGRWFSSVLVLLFLLSRVVLLASFVLVCFLLCFFCSACGCFWSLCGWRLL